MCAMASTYKGNMVRLLHGCYLRRWLHTQRLLRTHLEVACLGEVGCYHPMVNPNNNPSEIDKNRRVFELYPDGKTEFTLYDDDGTTQKYLANEKATTRITSDLK